MVKKIKEHGTVSIIIVIFRLLACIHPWRCKQPQETQGHVPEKESDFLQWVFVCCHMTTTMIHIVLRLLIF